MICIYVDHSGRIDQCLFQPVLDQFGCDDRINLTGDPIPADINKLNEAVCEDRTILAFVHTENNEDDWTQFAQNHENKVHLVLLSTSSDRFCQQGRYSSYENVWCFAPVDRGNTALMKAVREIKKALMKAVRGISEAENTTQITQALDSATTPPPPEALLAWYLLSLANLEVSEDLKKKAKTELQNLSQSDEEQTDLDIEKVEKYLSKYYQGT